MTSFQPFSLVSLLRLQTSAITAWLSIQLVFWLHHSLASLSFLVCFNFLIKSSVVGFWPEKMTFRPLQFAIIIHITQNALQKPSKINNEKSLIANVAQKFMKQTLGVDELGRIWIDAISNVGRLQRRRISKEAVGGKGERKIPSKQHSPNGNNSELKQTLQF